MRFLHISDSPLANQIARRSFDTEKFSPGEYMRLLQVSLETTRRERRKARINARYLNITTLAGLILMSKRNYSIEFVNIRLNKSDKKAFETWVKSQELSVDDYLEKLAMDGYKVSVSFDPERDTFISALTGKQTATHNVNKCFTSRSADLVDCIALMCYKHYGLAAGGDWDKIATEDDAWG